MLNLDEETEYLHRLVYLSNGTILMGEVLSLTQFGVLLKDPVSIISNDNKLFFSLLFNNMSDSRAFPINTTHIMSFANPNSIIIDHRKPWPARQEKACKDIASILETIRNKK